MKKIAFWIVGLATLLCTSCSPSVYSDQSPSVNFTSFKTYAFLPKVDSTKISVYNSGIIDEIIHKSIAAEMNSRNYSVDTKEPDLLIKFHLMVENREEIVNSPNYMYPPYWYGYAMPYPYFYYPGPMYMPNNFRKIEYKEGTLIIDFFERSTGKLAWRGWSTNNLDDLKKFEAHLPDKVKEILTNYPVKQK